MKLGRRDGARHGIENRLNKRAHGGQTFRINAQTQGDLLDIQSAASVGRELTAIKERAQVLLQGTGLVWRDYTSETLRAEGGDHVGREFEM